MFRTLLPLLLVGCAARRTGDAVGAIKFEYPKGENWEPTRVWLQGRPSARAVRNAMAHPQPRFADTLFPWFVEPAWLDREQLDEDAWRLEIWYANQGFFDARFQGWEIVPRGRPRAGVQRYVVRGHIAEGDPSTVRLIKSVGAERLPAPIRRRIARLLGGRGADVAAGRVFTYAAWQDTLASIRTLLAEQSYAYAKVEGDAAVYPEDHAVDVTVTIDPGPAAKFGEVTITGLKKVPEALVRDLVTVVPGKEFKASKLEETRSKLYALRVFGVVDVVPDLSNPTAAAVPVTIRVTEAKWRELRAGPAIQLDPGKASVALQASYRDDNVARRLWRLETDAQVGAGALVDSVDAVTAIAPADVKPIIDSTTALELPYVLGGDFSVKAEGRFQLGLERGYRKLEPSFSPALTYTGWEKLRPSVGYRIQYTDYLDRTIDLADIEGSGVSLDLTDPYLLSMLEQRLVYDGRNDPLSPTRGWYWSAGLAEAGLGGNYRFARGTGEVRTYRGIVGRNGFDPDLLFAGRIGGGVILPWGAGEEAAVPYSERLFLGGSNSVRGWGTNRLGPYVCIDPTEEMLAEDPNPAPCEENIDLQVPAGGNLQLFGNFEVRKGLPGDFTLALFTDVGRVWDRPQRFDFDELQWTVGLGLRYSTPVGPIRADFGWRLGDAEYFQAQKHWGFHFMLGEAF